jgi:hypothetical protein
MAAPARADGPRGGRVECRRPPRAEAAHVRRPRAPPMLSAGHGHDCFCASRWPRATRLRAADRMVALLPTLSRAGPPPVVARAVCETFTHTFRLDHRNRISTAGSDGCRCARLALHAVRIESARVVALHVRSVCAVSLRRCSCCGYGCTNRQRGRAAGRRCAQLAICADRLEPTPCGGVARAP